MNVIKRLFSKADHQLSLRPLYDAIVARAREPHWYEVGEVPDTIDGRFDMVSAILSLVLVRMEAIGEPASAASVHLTELFINDMDAQLRQLGVGDIGVGKHMGKMMSALGGRLGAYREALVDVDGLRGALVRNLYGGGAPSEAALDHVASMIIRLHSDLGQRGLADLVAGRLAAL
jgi:cytochrome b pre-mRNA-processing protein 3